MKQIKKILALVLVAVMMMALSVTASAASITITRDSSYSGTGDGNTYNYYKVFSADYASNTSTGGGSNNGAPGAVTGDASAVAYTATAGVASKLGTWVAATGTPGEAGYVAAHWEKATGNEWFELTPIAGSTNYAVSWVGDKTADRVQEAAAWLISKGAYEAGPTALTYTDGTGWTSGPIDPGYYLVEGATGKNLVAATTDVSIAEKNVYPPLDKTQVDEDDAVPSDVVRDVAIGDVLTYQVKVTIPATAAVGDKILVYDNKSIGLTYNNDVAVSSNAGSATVTPDGTANYSGANAVSGAVWQKLITVTDGSQGKDVIFTYTMTVNESALIDSEKENEAGLKFGPGDGTTPWPYESTPDEVSFKTYFAGIHKTDGDTHADLANVHFTLTENGAAFNVTKVGDYYIPGGSSNEVITDSQGLIMIRGLDEDKTYVLTETLNENPGYNMLASPVTLTLYEDTSATYTQATTYDSTVQYYNADGTPATVADAAAFAAGTFYTKGSETESFSTAAASKTDSKWGVVENNKGTLLPSTGGIGTTIFYVVGGLLVAAAVVVLITKRRMAGEE